MTFLKNVLSTFGVEYCFFCDTKLEKDKYYILHVSTLDGPLEVKVCQSCQEVLPYFEDMVGANRGDDESI